MRRRIGNDKFNITFGSDRPGSGSYGTGYTKPSRDDYHGGKFFAVIALALFAAYAGYEGWILLPDFGIVGSALGLIIVLVAIAVAMWMINRPSRPSRFLGGISMLVIGIIAAHNWDSIQSSFEGYSFSDYLWLIVGTFVVLAVAAWVSKKDSPVTTTP